MKTKTFCWVALITLVLLSISLTGFPFLIGPQVGSVWKFNPSDPFDKYAGATNTVLAVSNGYVLFNTSAEGGLTNLSVPVWTWRITQKKIQ